MGARLSELRGRCAALGQFLCRHLCVVVVMFFAAGLVASEASRQYWMREAGDYRDLWLHEHAAHRQMLTEQMDALEARAAALPAKEIPRAYQARLAVVRERFDGFVRAQRTERVCPSPSKQAAPATAGADEAPAPARCPMSAKQAADARAIRQQLIDLQAWVRDNTEAAR